MDSVVAVELFIRAVALQWLQKSKRYAVCHMFSEATVKLSWAAYLQGH